MRRWIVAALLPLIFAGCTTKRVTLDGEQLAAVEAAGVEADEIARLAAKPLYRMTPAETGEYLAYARQAFPDFRERVVHLGRKNIGQPYELYLLGEYPFEVHDPQPLYCLDKSDCVVFTEHIYAMALSDSWESFFWTLQRIHYRDGVIGVATRNHYTEADWNPSNSWLVTDVSRELAGASVATYKQKVDRAKFLAKRYKLERDIPVETIEEAFVPKDQIAAILPQLNNGDFVNIISTKDGGYFASHVGMVAVGEDGERHFLHSAAPKVREETFDAFIARCEARDARNLSKGLNKPQLAGFKFLRLNENPVVPPIPAQTAPNS